jgi:hypothetical protein
MFLALVTSSTAQLSAQNVPVHGGRNVLGESALSLTGWLGGQAQTRTIQIAWACGVLPQASQDQWSSPTLQDQWSRTSGPVQP